MMPGNYPLNLYHGDSYEWQFKLWLDEGKTQPLDLSDAVAKAEIRDKPGGDQIFALNCTILEPNIITVTLPAALCATVPIKTNLAWDLQLTYGSGSVNTVLAGNVSMRADVTDSTTSLPRAPRIVKVTG